MKQAAASAYHKIITALIATVTLVGAQRVDADSFNLIVQPNYPPDTAIAVYAPLTDYLNQATSHAITLVTTKNYHSYWSEMRDENAWHLVFDDPHFTDYRIKNQGYRPIVKTAEPTVFATIAGPAIARLERRALIGRRIATMPSPSIGFAFLSEWYTNPLAPPSFISSATSWLDAVEIVFADEADAAIVPLWVAERYPNLAMIEQTSERPGAAVSVSSAVPPEAAEEIREALLRLHEDESLYEVLVELNISRFVPATAGEYDGQGRLLRHFVGY